MSEKDNEIIEFSMLIPTRVLDNLKELQVRTATSDMGSTIMLALHIYSHLLRLQEEGLYVMVLDKKEQTLHEFDMVSRDLLMKLSTAKE